MKFNTNPVRGTVDYMPNEMEVRTFAEQTILNVYRANGFLQIKTPILENLELLTNGDDGDNQKLMFKTIKRGEKLDLSKQNLEEKDIVEEGLRYDLTVPLVRFFSNNKAKLPYPFKSIQIDEAFRAERPQKGRVRQFTQCDIDILGDSTPLAEIDLLVSGLEAYEKLGFEKLKVFVNDRQILNALVEKSGFNRDDFVKICISLDKFAKIGIDGVRQELIQNGFSESNIETLLGYFDKLLSAKNNDESFLILKEIGISSEIIDRIQLIIETVQKNVKPEFKILFNATIIRGQGYYTGTVYEIYEEDFGRAIGAGGRYDKMVEKMTGEAVPAVGFSIGFYSVVMLMIEKGFKPVSKKLALIYTKDDDFDEILKQKLLFINEGFQVSIFLFPKNFNNFAQKLKTVGYEKLVKMSNLKNIINL